jgi:YaiO family outer membrane protein
VQIDVWPDLWAGAYGHVKTGVSPGARVRPRGRTRSEVFQAFGPWELSGQHSWRRYQSEDVHQFGPGLGRYVGSWYLRTRMSLVPRPGTWGIAQRVGARRFYSPQSSLSHVDLKGGIGRSVEVINASSELLVTRTFFVSLCLRHFLSSHLGITAAVRYSDDGVFRRTGGALGVFGRW